MKGFNQNLGVHLFLFHLKLVNTNIFCNDVKGPKAKNKSFIFFLTEEKPI